MTEPTDIVGHSQITNSYEPRKYYSIFLNIMASIAKGFDAKIIKNVDDGMVCYFPKTSNLYNHTAFGDVIGFGVTTMAAHHNINTIICEEKLPTTINYRISVDYGKVEVAETIASHGAEDLFGSPMNVCAKINLKKILVQLYE